MGLTGLETAAVRDVFSAHARSGSDPLTNIAVAIGDGAECARWIPMAGSAAFRHNDTSIRLHQNPANQMVELPHHVLYSQILGVLSFCTSCFLLAQWVMRPRDRFHTQDAPLEDYLYPQDNVNRISMRVHRGQVRWWRSILAILGKQDIYEINKQK